MTKDGKPYGPIRYKELVRECYAITRNCNISYQDVLKMSVRERQYFIEFIQDEIKSMEKAQQEQQRKLNERK